MAARALKPTTRGQIRQAPQIEVRNEKVVRQTVDDVNDWLREAGNRINSGLSLGDGVARAQAGNFDAQILADVNSPTMADKQFQVSHDLGRTPVGFEITFRNKGGIVYATGKASLGKTALFLRCSVASMTFDMRVW